MRRSVKRKGAVVVSGTVWPFAAGLQLTGTDLCSFEPIMARPGDLACDAIRSAACLTKEIQYRGPYLVTRNLSLTYWGVRLANKIASLIPRICHFTS